MSDQVWTCGTCTFENTKGGSSCEICGAARPASAAVVQGTKCTMCAHMNPPGSRFCVGCGLAMGSPASPAAAAAPSTPVPAWAGGAGGEAAKKPSAGAAPAAAPAVAPVATVAAAAKPKEASGGGLMSRLFGGGGAPSAAAAAGASATTASAGAAPVVSSMPSAGSGSAAAAAAASPAKPQAAPVSMQGGTVTVSGQAALAAASQAAQAAQVAASSPAALEAAERAKQQLRNQPLPSVSVSQSRGGDFTLSSFPDQQRRGEDPLTRAAPAAAAAAARPAASAAAPAASSAPGSGFLSSAQSFVTSAFPSAFPSSQAPERKRAPADSAAPQSSQQGALAAAQPARTPVPAGEQKKWMVTDEVKARMIDYHQQFEIRALIQHYAEQGQQAVANGIPKTIALTVDQVVNSIAFDLGIRLTKRWQDQKGAATASAAGIGAGAGGSSGAARRDDSKEKKGRGSIVGSGGSGESGADGDGDESELASLLALVHRDLTQQLKRALKYGSEGDQLLGAFNEFTALCFRTDPTGGYTDAFVRETVRTHQGVYQGVNTLPHSALVAFVEPLTKSLLPSATSCLEECFQVLSSMISSAVKAVYQEQEEFGVWVSEECVGILAAAQQRCNQLITNFVHSEAQFLFPAPPKSLMKRAHTPGPFGCAMCAGITASCSACEGCICAACSAFRMIPAVGEAPPEDGEVGEDGEPRAASAFSGYFDFQLKPGDQWQMVNEDQIRPTADQILFRAQHLEQRSRETAQYSDYRDFVREQARAGRTLVVVQVGERGYIGRESKDGNEDADNFLVVRGGGGGQAQEGAWSQGALMRAFFDPGKGRGSRRVTWVHAFDDPPTSDPLLQFEILLNNCHPAMGGMQAAARGRMTTLRPRGFWLNTVQMLPTAPPPGSGSTTGGSTTGGGGPAGHFVSGHVVHAVPGLRQDQQPAQVRAGVGVKGQQGQQGASALQETKLLPSKPQGAAAGYAKPEPPASVAAKAGGAQAMQPMQTASGQAAAAAAAPAKKPAVAQPAGRRW